MAGQTNYLEVEPSRSEIDSGTDSLVVEFGAPWCTHCQAAQSLIVAALAKHPGVRRIKVEDGKGRPLGRSFGVKLWPTLIFLRQGKEVSRLVRPGDASAIEQALAQIDTPS